MLKGAQKRMIVVRTRDSRLFEEAYFVMRHDLPEEAADGSDLVREACRLIEAGGANSPHAAEAARPHPPKGSRPADLHPRRRIFRRILWFGAGGLAGGLLTYLLLLLG